MINVTEAQEAAAKLAVAKGSDASVKAFFERACEEACAGLYAECAMLAGVSIEQWLESASKGEF